MFQEIGLHGFGLQHELRLKEHTEECSRDILLQGYFRRGNFDYTFHFDQINTISSDDSWLFGVENRSKQSGTKLYFKRETYYEGK